MKKKTVEEIEQLRQLSGCIGKLERSRRRYMNEHLSHLGLVGHQFIFLFTLFHEPGISQEELVETLGIDKTRIARSALQLEQLGYISRERDPHNRRKYCLRLTKEGEELIPQIRSVIADWGSIITEGLSFEEIRTALELLKVMRNNTNEK